MDDEQVNPLQKERLRLGAAIVASYVGHNTIPVAQVPNLIGSVFDALGQILTGTTQEPPQEPAVSVRKSITPDYLVCLEDGKKLKMLKRHLRTMYNMSPEEYRAKWGLPSDYPMVAPGYSKARSSLAKSIGLGKPRTEGTTEAAHDQSGDKGRRKKSH